ncbi:MAG: SpoIIE family protein phosphatase, partial [Gammaproteobacteria bacterium]|nr:SpoIIE family protein phosphatase [Gammaproteobacteria bacterium]
MTSTAEYHLQEAEAEAAALLRANTHLQREVDKRQRIEHMLVRRNRQMLADLRLAAEFQRSLLPELPALPHLDMAVRYRPYAQVSGDVYDFALNREGAVGVLVGDATGHGLTAAFMTMLAQSSLDSIRGDLPTDATLSR